MFSFNIFLLISIVMSTSTNAQTCSETEVSHCSVQQNVTSDFGLLATACVCTNATCLPGNIPCQGEKSILFINSNITTIPKRAFAQYKNVTVLDLHGGQISMTEIGAFHGIETLEQLSLNDNKLRSITKSFIGLSALTELHLTNNIINNIERKALAPLKNLQFLNLQYNIIEDVSFCTVLFDLPNLKVLNLMHNLIMRIMLPTNGHKQLMNNLTVLDMSDNKLKSFPVYLYDNLPYLGNTNLSEISYLNLKTNPLICDCNLRYFFTRNVSLDDEERCSDNSTKHCGIPHVNPDLNFNYAQPGSNVLLGVTIQGSPHSVVGWLNNKAKRIVTDYDPINGRTWLLVTNITEDDYGTYYCWANNDHASEETSMMILDVPTENSSPRQHIAYVKNLFVFTLALKYIYVYH